MTDRRPLVAANWKLHKTLGEAVALAEDLYAALTEDGEAALRDVDIVIAPVFTALARVHAALSETGIALAGQNVFEQDSGAFTGEVSAPLLADAGCTYCIIGHSERRQHFGETDDGVHRKLEALLRHRLVPIVCVGETLEQREAGDATEVIVGQLDRALGGIAPADLHDLVVAYEPVWAIGTGRTATAADAQAAHAALRAHLEGRDAKLGADTRILYGGSVKPDNAAELLAERDIDGALVGGASLQAGSFADIVRASL